MFYWELGEMISLKQKKTRWGSKFIEQIANDLKKEFPSLKGFSRTNLFYIKEFYEFYSTDLIQLRVGLNKNLTIRNSTVNGEDTRNMINVNIKPQYTIKYKL
jgi:hypothetical protein